jgi:ferredoxin-NADP reductase
VEGAALLGRLTWQFGDVVDLVEETAHVKTLVLDVPAWPGHRAGQHVDVRLTAEDGYQAERSYSIASAPSGTGLELTDELRPGDKLELRGPVGGYFVWEPSVGGPVLLVGGGSGAVPLMAMIRERAAAGSDVDMRLLLSSRGWEEIVYRDELARLTGDGLVVVHTLTRSQPDGWSGYARRVDSEMLAEVGPAAKDQPHVYVCGPTPFVEAVANALVGVGHEPHEIKTERFGPTGG